MIRFIIELKNLVTLLGAAPWQTKSCKTLYSVDYKFSKNNIGVYTTKRNLLTNYSRVFHDFPLIQYIKINF